MSTDLQEVVDHLASLVELPVVLEDGGQRMIAHSPQAEPIDGVRRDSILQRKTDPEVVTWFQSFGISTAREPLRIPEHVELGILARVCCPVRYRDHLYGYLWLIDARGVCDTELDVVGRAAEHAAMLLYEEGLSRRLSSQVLTYLLSASEELRLAAAEQIVDQGLLPEGGFVAAIVVQPLHPFDHDVTYAVEEALADVSWQAAQGDVIRAALGDHGVLLTWVGSKASDKRALTMASAVRAALERRLAKAFESPRVVTAVGDPVSDLSRAIASYRQARLASRVASTVPGMPEVVRWCDLGVFRALSQIAPNEVAQSALDPRLVALLEAGEHAVALTLETYLDLAGDAKATADQLHLHRGTLYYRLEKAERIAGIDMHNGFDRLSIHLGFKLARLAGLMPSNGPGGPPDDP